MSQLQVWALKISAILWIIWGLVHIAGGVITIGGDTAAGFQGIAAAVEPGQLEANYHPAVGAVLNQHGWNLLWVGVVTTIGAFYIWRRSVTGIWVTGMVGGLFDIGYFVFIDLGGFGTFFPGTSMTIVSATAIVLSFYIWRVGRAHLSPRPVEIS